MKKFTTFAQDKQTKKEKSGGTNSQTAFEFLKKIASKYEGASESKLIEAILSEAKKARAEGSLTDEEIENFVATISPMLSSAQRKQLEEVVMKIKNS